MRTHRNGHQSVAGCALPDARCAFVVQVQRLACLQPSGNPRRAALEQIGPLDESFFFFGEETDWCRRMRDAGWRLMFAPVGEIIYFDKTALSEIKRKGEPN
jgi:hypothetical protein